MIVTRGVRCHRTIGWMCEIRIRFARSSSVARRVRTHKTHGPNVLTAWKEGTKGTTATAGTFRG